MITLLLFSQLDPTPGGIVSGVAGDYGKGQLIQNGELLVMLIFLAVLMLSLTEPMKVLYRKNIGLKALNLQGILAGCAVYLLWSLIIFFLLFAGAVALFQDNNFFENLKKYWHLIIIGLYMAGQAGFMFTITLKVLHLGMLEHYRAKAENSTAWEVLEYRGDSFVFSKNFSQGWTKEKVWRIAEPKYTFKTSIVCLFLMPIIGIPFFFTSISFWVNEWYQVYYKHEKMKQAYLDMKIEMQKANLYFNQSMNGSTIAKVSKG